MSAIGLGWREDPKIIEPTDAILRLAATCVSGSACLAFLSAKQMSAGRIVAMSRHYSRQKLAREFDATEIVAERGDEAVARIKDMTKGIGADSVLECVDFNTRNGSFRDSQTHALRGI